MRLELCVALAAVTLVSWPPLAVAQDLRKVFKDVSPSVVVIRASGQEITSSGTTHFSETGSGVLISQDGKVMTAAHVVHAMTDIKVQFLGGEGRRRALWAELLAERGLDQRAVGAQHGVQEHASRRILTNERHHQHRQLRWSDVQPRPSSSCSKRGPSGAGSRASC